MEKEIIIQVVAGLIVVIIAGFIPLVRRHLKKALIAVKSAARFLVTATAPFWVFVLLLIMAVASIPALSNPQNALPRWAILLLGAGVAGAIITLLLFIIVMVRRLRKKAFVPAAAPLPTPLLTETDEKIIRILVKVDGARLTPFDIASRARESRLRIKHSLGSLEEMRFVDRAPHWAGYHIFGLTREGIEYAIRKGFVK